ncbi:MAG: DUF924 family protein [Sandaracinaceae bacterium]
MTATPDDVLQFWLGDLDADGCASEEAAKRWWLKSDAFDGECTTRFRATHQALRAGTLDDWLERPRGRLAYVIVADQLSRNMFRGSGEMYSADTLATQASLDAMDAGVDQDFGYHERYFLYMPFMHAEDVALQDRCVALFEGLVQAFPSMAKNAAMAHDYAIKHRDIVARFGRFPHRNALLGRDSSEEEKAFLQQPGSSF